eukprot:TRINITY_DN82528_c0_g1_i1.p1 TRINITY_DN82528_c0_g1~~TRINITY_DN82528_c0_g1_i1.p1  ORF type:complete len:100 (-),score=18.71 TRINITY_DN82528_c0_g1_i1:4-303(-)
MGDPRIGGRDMEVHERLFDLNNEFVRCVVPKERLFEINVFDGPTDSIMLELSQFLGLPPLDAEYPHCVGGSKQKIVPISELLEQSPYCPIRLVEFNVSQ